MSDLKLELEKLEEPKTKLVCRLSRTAWHDGRGLHIKTSLMFLRRKSSGFNILEEECSMIGAMETAGNFTNIHECKDGIYEVVLCNEKRDWETGHIEEWDYKLIPMEETK